MKDDHRTSVIHTDSDQVLSVFTQNHVLKLFLRILKKKKMYVVHTVTTEPSPRKVSKLVTSVTNAP